MHRHRLRALAFPSLLLAAAAASAACGKDEAKAPPAKAEPATAAKAEPATAAKAEPTPADPVRAAIDAADRTADDRALDAGREPYELLTFLKVAPGMKVAELFAGGGYTVELLARVVGPTGKVYGQNNKWVLERFAEQPWRERLARPANAGVVRVDRELEDPLPPEATDLDLVVTHLVYHDFVWLKTDRSKLNAAVFRALRSGGEYVVVDHSAAAGAGLTVAESLHRIEPDVVRAEVEAAGFVLDREGDFLRHAEDTRDWSTSPRTAGYTRGTSDRFVLVFRKP